MKKTLSTILLLLLFSYSLPARDGDGGYAGAFLRMGIGARAKALGDAHTAIPEGAISAIYNPALLPHLKNRQLALSVAFLPLDRKLNYIGYAQSLNPPVGKDEEEIPLKAGFALAWIHAGVDDIDGRDGSGNPIGEFSNSENAFYLSFALSPSPLFSIGVSGKVLYNRFPGIAQEDKAVTSTGFGLDVGAYLTPIKNLMFGIALRDNNSKYTWNTGDLWDLGTSTTYKFPKIFRGAIAWRIPQEWLLLTAEIEDSEKQLRRYHAGAEFSYKHMGAIRIGYDENQPTFGLALFGDILGMSSSINYAFGSEESGAGTQHIFTWDFNL